MRRKGVQMIYILGSAILVLLVVLVVSGALGPVGDFNDFGGEGVDSRAKQSCQTRVTNWCQSNGDGAQWGGVFADCVQYQSDIGDGDTQCPLGEPSGTTEPSDGMPDTATGPGDCGPNEKYNADFNTCIPKSGGGSEPVDEGDYCPYNTDGYKVIAASDATTPNTGGSADCSNVFPARNIDDNQACCLLKAEESACSSAGGHCVMNGAQCSSGDFTGGSEAQQYCRTTGADVSACVKKGVACSSPGDDGNTGDDPSDKRTCKPLHQSGSKAEKADIVLVAREYSDVRTMLADFRYYIDWDGNNRGLFGVYPMNVSKNKFNVWYMRSQDSKEEYDSFDSIITAARENWFPQCSFADYNIVMSKDQDGSFPGFTVGNDMFIDDVHAKVQKQDGAITLIHEWGHGFAGVADEYQPNSGEPVSGRSHSSRPNCAPDKDTAEQWWGDMATANPAVGYEKGCINDRNSWEPHPGGTIMGDGGKWRYGPVNDRAFRQELNKYE